MPRFVTLHRELPARPSKVVVVIGTFVWLAVLLFPTVASSCPTMCLCRWKGGKETTECSGKGLMAIPPGIDVGTQVLDMTGSNLQTLPKEIFLRNGLLNLQKIYVVNCNLHHIDRHAFSRLSNLVELDLSNNVLTVVPSESFVGSMPDLRRLVLNGNPIREIEANAFSTLRSLIILELVNCQISEVNDGAFARLPNLQQVKLSGNRLRTLPSNVLKDLKSLHSILLVDNPWTCDCHAKDLRRWLLASGVPYYISPQCSEPSRLRGFDINRLVLEEFACAPTAANVIPGIMAASSLPIQLVQARHGTNVSLECHVSSDPEAFIHWLWKDMVITNTTGTVTSLSESDDLVDARTYVVEESVHGLEKTSTLVLEALDERDEGNYVCVAENRGGRYLVNFTVEVVVAPPVSKPAPIVVEKSFLVGVAIGLGLFVLVILVIVCALIMRFYRSRKRRKWRRKQKLPRSETQETKGSSMSDSQNDPLNDKRDLQPAGCNPIQKPPRSYANATYVSTSEISLHDYTNGQQHPLPIDQDGAMLLTLSREPHSGVYSIKPDILKVDTGEYSVPRMGQLPPQLINGNGGLGLGADVSGSSNIYQNTARWANESPIATCHGCEGQAGSCLGVPCLQHGSDDPDADLDSERSYRANCRPTASGLAGVPVSEYDNEEWPRPPPPLAAAHYDTVRKSAMAVDVWQSQSSSRIPPRIDEVPYENVDYPAVAAIAGPAAVWERQSPATVAAAAAAGTAGGGYPGHQGEDFSQDNPGASNSTNAVHLKNSVPGLSPFPLLNLSTVRDSPDEGYEDEGEEGTEV